MTFGTLKYGGSGSGACFRTSSATAQGTIKSSRSVASAVWSSLNTCAIGSTLAVSSSFNFPMYSKISVAGKDKAPLYQFPTDKAANPKTGGEIQWNFTKFLVDRDGRVIARFEPAVEPQSKEVVSAVEAALKK